MEVWQEIAKNAECGAERLVAEYGDRLYAAAALLCRNNCDAEDLVFRTLARAVDKIRQFKPSGDFFSWLYKILLNFHRMDARRKRPDIVSVGSAQESALEGHNHPFLRHALDCRIPRLPYPPHPAGSPRRFVECRGLRAGRKYAIISAARFGSI
jgi:DNA-directed RNA polymerase specialized sigma24 family protein